MYHELNDIDLNLLQNTFGLCSIRLDSRKHEWRIPICGKVKGRWSRRRAYISRISVSACHNLFKETGMVNPFQHPIVLATDRRYLELNMEGRLLQGFLISFGFEATTYDRHLLWHDGRYDPITVHFVCTNKRCLISRIMFVTESRNCGTRFLRRGQEQDFSISKEAYVPIVFHKVPRPEGKE